MLKFRRISSLHHIRMDPANVLVARLGSHFEVGSMNRFYERLLYSDTLPGL